MSQEGMNSNLGPEAHRAEIVDPAEKLVAQEGDDESAITTLEKQLEEDPEDREALRQLNLIKNRTEDILKRAEELRKERLH